MGVHWALNAAKNFKGQIEIVDLRTLYPLDTEMVFKTVKRHNKCLVITEEPVDNTFARSLSSRIQEECFRYLDAPVITLGSENMPAIPLNSVLEETMLPNAEKVAEKMDWLLKY
jgi:2-oxoisovalerate dehydrogenase E1 component